MSSRLVSIQVKKLPWYKIQGNKTTEQKKYTLGKNVGPLETKYSNCCAHLYLDHVSEWTNQPYQKKYNMHTFSFVRNTIIHSISVLSVFPVPVRFRMDFQYENYTRFFFVGTNPKKWVLQIICKKKRLHNCKDLVRLVATQYKTSNMCSNCGQLKGK